MVRQGFVQVYTGAGKGKTTAAVGLAVRAAGAGLRVFFSQFLKRGDYGEIRALERFADLVAVRQFGPDAFITGPPSTEEIRQGADGLEAARAALLSGCYDMVILDEANVAATVGLFDAAALLELIAARPAPVELVLTGRGADPRVVEAADLVTEMLEIKHYFRQGVPAREGIER